MSVQVKRRRDTATNIASFTPAQGELIVDTTNNRVIVGDGTTVGGWPAAKLSEVSTAPSRTPVADANYSILTTDKNIAYTSITAARTVALCAAASYPVGTRLTIFDESGSASSTKTITIGRAGADTIDGATTAVISSAYGVMALESNGSNKWTITDQSNSNLGPVGIGTAADPSNPLSVYGSSALFNGTNFSFTVNKAASSDVASIIFEDAFSLRAQMGLLNTDNFAIKVSPNGSSYYAGLSIDNSTGAPTFGNARTAVSDANYTALATDREVAYTAITAARTVTLPAASAFPAGHALVIVDESGAVTTTDTITVNATGSDTIDGLTSATLSTAYGYCRLFSNGSNAWTVVGRSVNILTFTASATYVPTPGMTKVDVYVVSGGGGGGGGCLEAASTACSGGGGGGGGAVKKGVFSAVEVGASAAVVVGAGGTAGAAATTSSTAGGNGGGGGLSGFGPQLYSYGSGGGAGGQLSATASGGGGGGGPGTGNSGSGATGGGAISPAGAGGSGAAGGNAYPDFAGAGGGGCSAAGVAGAGGNSSFSASGGGSGGGISSANVAQNGATGGYIVGTIYRVSQNGVAGGTVNGHYQPTLQNFLQAGNGGGGGAAATSGTAGIGGLGTFPGGGGGGGGSAQNGGTAGAGGAGGAGLVIVVESF